VIVLLVSFCVLGYIFIIDKKLYFGSLLSDNFIISSTTTTTNKSTISSIPTNNNTATATATSIMDPSAAKSKATKAQNQHPSKASQPNHGLDTRPILILHIGPHKTATSTIQCDLAHYREELYADASVVFLGRTYAGCIKSKRKSNVKSSSSSTTAGITKYEYEFNSRALIDRCFTSPACSTTDESSSAWKKLEKTLANLSKNNQSVILSDEAFSRMTITVPGDGDDNNNDNNIDNRQILYRLFSKYYPGRVHVVITYRRHFEWMYSYWNEIYKPYMNGNNNPNPYQYGYKKDRLNWPSEGGKRSKTFLEYITRTLPSPSTIRQDKYTDIAESEHIHVVEYLQRLWSNYSSEVVVFNLHNEINSNSNSSFDVVRKEDTTTRFLRYILPPLVADTFVTVKDGSYNGRPNTSRNLDYDRLAVAAYENGLLVNQTTNIARFKVTELIEEYLFSKLNNTYINNLPMQCPNETQLENLLHTSLEYEDQIMYMLYPTNNQSSSSSSDDNVAATKQQKLTFFEAVQKQKFCNLDTEKLIEDHAVQEFFTVNIPQLLLDRSK
jgi:hypothetical protein